MYNILLLMGYKTTQALAVQCFLARVVLIQNMANSRDILGFQDLEMPLSFGGQEPGAQLEEPQYQDSLTTEICLGKYQ